MEFLVTNSRYFLVTNSMGNFLLTILQKTREYVDKICGNSWEFPEKSSLDSFPGNFLETIPKIFSRVPQAYHDLFSSYSWVDTIVVNNLTTYCIAPPTYNQHLNQNISIIFDLTEVAMHFVYSENWIVKKKWNNFTFFSKHFSLKMVLK